MSCVARWCGSCGAIVEADERGSTPSPPDAPGPPTGRIGGGAPPAIAVDDPPPPPVTHRGRRRWTVVAGVLFVVVVAAVAPWPGSRTVPAAVVGAVGDARGVSPSPDPGSDLAVRWRIDGARAPERDARIAVAGDAHVLVGREVVATGSGASAVVRRWPESLSGAAFAPDGRWAVAELGGVVVGGLGTVGTEVVPVAPGSWSPVGPARAWLAGTAVFTGDDGRLGAIPVGEVGPAQPKWVTRVAVVPDGPVGDGVLTGRTLQGGLVAVDLHDGTVADLGGGTEVLAVGDGLVVTGDGRQWFAHAGRGLELVWRRPAIPDARPVGVGGGVGVVGPDGASLLGGDGAVSSVLTNQVVVGAVRGAVLVRGGSELLALGWDGRLRWRVDVDPRAVVVGLDRDRFGLVRSGSDGPVVQVRASASGEVLAERRAGEAVPRSTSVITAAVDGVVGLRGAGDTRLAGLDWRSVSDGDDGRGRVRDLLGEVAGSWRVVGAVDLGGRPALVQLRRLGEAVGVRRGSEPEVVVEVDLAGAAVAPPTGVGSVLAFRAPGGGTRLVDPVGGSTVDVPDVDVAVGVGDLLLGRPTTGPNGGAPELWAVDGSGTVRWSAPALVGGAAVGHAMDPVGPLPGGGPVQVGAVALRALDPRDGATVWSVTPPAPVAVAPVLAAQDVVVALADGRLLAVDATDGTQRWLVDLRADPTAATAAGGAVFVGTADGRVVRVAPGGEVDGTWQVADRAVVDLVVVDGVVVVVTTAQVVGLGITDGRPAPSDRVDVP